MTVRLAPLPLNATLAAGTKIGLLELALSVRLDAAVTESPTVKVSAVVALFFIVVALEMLVMVGAATVVAAVLTTKIG